MRHDRVDWASRARHRLPEYRQPDPGTTRNTYLQPFGCMNGRSATLVVASMPTRTNPRPPLRLRDRQIADRLEPRPYSGATRAGRKRAVGAQQLSAILDLPRAHQHQPDNPLPEND